MLRTSSWHLHLYLIKFTYWLICQSRLDWQSTDMHTNYRPRVDRWSTVILWMLDWLSLGSWPTKLSAAIWSTYQLLFRSIFSRYSGMWQKTPYCTPYCMSFTLNLHVQNMWVKKIHKSACKKIHATFCKWAWKFTCRSSLSACMSIEVVMLSRVCFIQWFLAWLFTFWIHILFLSDASLLHVIFNGFTSSTSCSVIIRIKDSQQNWFSSNPIYIFGVFKKELE